MTLNLRSDIAGALQIIASSRGLSVEDYLADLVAKELPGIQPAGEPKSGFFIEEGLPVFYSGKPLSQAFLDETFSRLREERSRQILSGDS